MNAEKRGIITFVGLGLLSAAGVGVGVWHASSPTPASVESQSVTTSSADDEAVSTTSESHSEKPAVKKSREKEPDASSDATASSGKEKTTDQAAGIENDPFLAPNAHINTEKREAQPTRSYRPGNISAGQQGTQSGTNSGNTNRGTGSQTGQTGNQNRQEQDGAAPQQPVQPDNSNSGNRETPVAQPSSTKTPDSTPTSHNPEQTERTDGTTTEPSAGESSDNATAQPSDGSGPGETAAEHSNGDRQAKLEQQAMTTTQDAGKNRQPSAAESADRGEEGDTRQPAATEPTDSMRGDNNTNEAGLPAQGEPSANPLQ